MLLTLLWLGAVFIQPLCTLINYLYAFNCLWMVFKVIRKAPEGDTCEGYIYICIYLYNCRVSYMYIDSMKVVTTFIHTIIRVNLCKGARQLDLYIFFHCLYIIRREKLISFSFQNKNCFLTVYMLIFFSTSEKLIN